MRIPHLIIALLFTPFIVSCEKTNRFCKVDQNNMATVEDGVMTDVDEILKRESADGYPNGNLL